MGRRQVARHRVLVPAFGGSNPPDPANLFMNGYVYFLKSLKKDNWVYVGSTADIKKRSKEHNAGKCKSTKGYRPLELIYFEKFENLKEARERERYFKTGIGFDEKYKIIQKLNREIP